MFKLLVLAGLAGGAFYAWKKLMTPPEEDDLGPHLPTPLPNQPAQN